ncbi:hypothetical protein GIB67_015280 [Kingdonia uniflora]|uniref:Uncharacterized protein n=1 Tax=Kingdonia uniflora TaxID=39325 RepID=A0A7J7MSZ5_9MAGN|nr:hypothetical protein GIB67_015280 [Kingdonia uniflora]
MHRGLIFLSVLGADIIGDGDHETGLGCPWIYSKCKRDGCMGIMMLKKSNTKEKKTLIGSSLVTKLVNAMLSSGWMLQLRSPNVRLRPFLVVVVFGLDLQSIGGNYAHGGPPTVIFMVFMQDEKIKKEGNERNKDVDLKVQMFLLLLSHLLLSLKGVGFILCLFSLFKKPEVMDSDSENEWMYGNGTDAPKATRFFLSDEDEDEEEEENNVISDSDFHGSSAESENEGDDGMADPDFEEIEIGDEDEEEERKKKRKKMKLMMVKMMQKMAWRMVQMARRQRRRRKMVVRRKEMVGRREMEFRL